MKLLVDIGNSRIKWGFGTVAGFVAGGEARNGEGEELATLIGAPHRPAEIRIANVAGAEVGVRIAARLHEHFGVAPVFARSAESGAGVKSGYADPAQLGVDRWLAICAAFARYRAPLCVIDAGTATTMDIVHGGGEHQGGLIVPGITLMQSALLGGTGELARLSADGKGGEGEVDHGLAASSRTSGIHLGRNTAAAIFDGTLQATACLSRACLNRLRDHTEPGKGQELLVLTGGAAMLLAATMLRMAGSADSTVDGFRLEHRPHLVLEGLALDPPCFRMVT